MECTIAVDVGRDQEGHSCIGDSGNVWVLLEVVGFLGNLVALFANH